jgi:hypothetical protein
MLILMVCEFGLAALIVVGIVTQIIIPLFRGTPIFPALHKHGLEAKLESAKQEVRIAKLEREIEDLQKQALAMRTPTVVQNPDDSEGEVNVR